MNHVNKWLTEVINWMEKLILMNGIFIDLEFSLVPKILKTNVEFLKY